MDNSESIHNSSEVVCYDSTTSDLPDDGFEVWHELCRPMFMTEALRKIKSYQTKYAFSEVGGMIFSHCLYSATRYIRTPDRSDAGEADGAVLHLYWTGREEVRIYDKVYEMAPDRIVLHDWGHPYVSETTDADQISVHIPPNLLHDRHSIHGRMPFITWMLDSIEGQLLAETLTKVWMQIVQHGPDKAEAAAAGFIGLLNGLIDVKLSGLKTPTESLPISSLMIKSYLMRRLGDPGLSVDTLCKAFKCSKATIYRHFAEAGGVNNYIQNQRLEACMRDLQRTEMARPTTREIAKRWGFEDVSYFHKLFKQKYAMTPGDAARCVEREAQKQPFSGLDEKKSRNIATLHGWLRVRPGK